MFGYINIKRTELTEESKTAYQAYYCGLCRALKTGFGIKGQILINYDMTFLIVLLTGLYELEDQTAYFTCALHPAKKQLMYVNEATDYAADMNIALAYHNLIDDWKDEKAYTKMLLARRLHKDYVRIREKYPRQVRAIERYMRKTSKAEQRRETNLDAVSGLTGEMLGEIFCWKEDEWAGELKTLGFYMGKFIYLMDAYEDFETDLKKKRYNPFWELVSESSKDRDIFCKLLLTSMMAECAKSFERLPILLHADILRNVLYSGVWTEYEYLKQKKNKNKKETATQEKRMKGHET